jgi:hypothetical protein
MASGTGDNDVHRAGRQVSNFRSCCKYGSKEGLQGLKLIRFSSRVAALSDASHYITRSAPPPLLQEEVAYRWECCGKVEKE